MCQQYTRLGWQRMKCPAGGRLFGSPFRCPAVGPSRLFRVNSKGGDDDDSVQRKVTKLEGIIKRKKEKIEGLLTSMGEEALDERLQSATQQGAGPNAFAFSTRVAEVGMMEGRPLLIFEVARRDPSEPSEMVAERATKLVQAGADALAVRTDEESSPEGEKDLFFVCRACPDVPVFCRDWFLHPIQIVEAKSAGCSGILGIVASITSRGSAVLSSFGAALGLDCPVEIVNLKEKTAMEQLMVPFYCMDISVSLSVGIPGFQEDVIGGLLQELPFGSLSIVGIRDINGARKVREYGADGIYVKKEIVDRHEGDELSLVTSIKSLVDGD